MLRRDVFFESFCDDGLYHHLYFRVRDMDKRKDVADSFYFAKNVNFDSVLLKALHPIMEEL